MTNVSRKLNVNDDSIYFSSPEIIISSVPEIFNVILSHLDFSTLKKLRLVDTIRKIFATEELNRRGAAYLKLVFIRGFIYPKPIALLNPGEYQLHSNSRKKLPALVSILENTRDFLPWTTLEIRDGCLQHPSIQRLFSLIGHRIHSLTLSGEFVGNYTHLLHLLQVQCPNIENLFLCHTICNMHWPGGGISVDLEQEQDEQSRSAVTINLPNLRVLGASEDDGSYVSPEFSRFPLEIIKSAPNLHSVLYFIIPEFGNGTDKREMEKLKYFYLHTEFTDLSDIRTMANSCPKLIKLDLQYSAGFDRNWLDEPAAAQMWFEDWNLNRIRWAETLSVHINKILQSSKDTLEDLVLSTSTFPMVNLPKLSKVKRLRIFQSPVDPFREEEDLQIFLGQNNNNNNGDGGPFQVEIEEYVFPVNLNLRQTFPALESVILNLEMREDEQWLKFFPNLDENANNMKSQEKLESVKKLEISKYVKATLWVKIGQIFPNVKQLTITNHSELREVVPEISSMWRKLETWRLKMKTGQNLDLVFTGTSSTLDDFCIDEKWFSRLTCLKTLEIFACRGISSLWNSTPPISKFSYDFAFNQIQNLQVIIGYDHNLITPESSPGFNSISPYVTKFVHFDGY